MKKTLDIFTHHYFPFHFIALGFAFIPVIVVPMYPILSIILLPIALLLMTTHYRLRIDAERKTYKEYIWLLGYKKGTEIPYQHIDFIYINKVNITSEYGYVARVHSTAPVFRGYLKLSSDENLFITENRKEQKILKRLQKIADFTESDIQKNY